MSRNTNLTPTAAADAQTSAASSIEQVFASGLALHQKGELAQAQRCYEQVLAEKPDHSDALQLLGAIALARRQFAQAIDWLDASLRLKPDQVQALLNKAAALKELGRLNEALACHDKALAISPGNALVHFTRAMVLKELLRLNESLAGLNTAISLNPQYADAHYSKATLLLLMGRFAEGWPMYEWRWRIPDLRAEQPVLKSRLWSGEEPLHGKTILLYGEQGLGDMIQFARFVLLVAAKGAKVVLAVNKSVTPLLSRLPGVMQTLLAGDAIPPHDFHCPLMSLPRAFKTTLTNMPPAGPYLKATDAKRAQWTQWLGKTSGLRVGLVWSGNPSHKNDSQRSVALQALLPCLPQGPQYVCLQKELRAEDAARIKTRPDIRFAGEELKDFEDTAALCGQMDLVISVDTSVAHLAGALGRPVWLLLPQVPDWRWMLERSDSPWYASAKLYRQTSRGDWPGVLARVGKDLALFAAKQNAAAPQAAMPQAKVASQAAPKIQPQVSITPTRRVQTLAISPLFEQGLKLHKQGDLAQARQVYEQVLTSQPGHFDAQHLLGVVALQSGQYQLAHDLIDKALRLNHAHATAHVNKGVALKELGRLQESLASHDKAIELMPRNADALVNRGVTLKELGRFDEAIASYRQALEIRPDHDQSHFNLGNALRDCKRFEQALDSFDKAIALNPANAMAHCNRGMVLQDLKRHAEAGASADKAIALMPGLVIAHNLRGMALDALHQPQAAIASFDEALRLDPNHANAHYNLGIVQAKLAQHELALASYDKAIALEPGFADAHVNRGIALVELRRPEEAKVAYEQAIALKPGLALAHSNLGNVLREMDDDEAALRSYDKAMALDPDFPEPRWNKALALLLSGDLAAGLPLYEARKDVEQYKHKKRYFAQDPWLGGQDLAGKTILLYAEQGLGDTIQFCRYVPMVAALGAKVILEVQVPLLGLLSGLGGVSEMVASGSPLPRFDCHCSLMSLPLAFETRLDTIPAGHSYLKPSPKKSAVWTRRMGAAQGLRIGLAWSGNPQHKNDHNRSLPLRELLASLPKGPQYVCIQKEVRDSDKALLEANPQIRFYGPELGDFEDTAALCRKLDLIVSVDTSVAHLAGAMGKPVWLLLPNVPDWRWLLERIDSPWYASMKLYRQTSKGDWAGVLKRLRKDLQRQIVAG